jgi:ADP-L-glycero-D-manno-heptose 6-epimerase
MLEKFPHLKLFKHGEQKREWIYVKDVVKANLLAAGFNGREIFNCGTGNPVTFNEIVETLAEIQGEKANVEYIDNPYEDKYQTHVETDMNKADVMLGFKPEYDLEKGLRDYVSG